jgi:hypothetical protein
MSLNVPFPIFLIILNFPAATRFIMKNTSKIQTFYLFLAIWKSHLLNKKQGFDKNMMNKEETNKTPITCWIEVKTTCQKRNVIKATLTQRERWVTLLRGDQGIDVSSEIVAMKMDEVSKFCVQVFFFFFELKYFSNPLNILISIFYF